MESLETAVMVGIISVFLIKKLKIKTISGEEIHIDNKTFDKGQIYGGLIFGIGWAITGACPGPLFAQIGAGFGVVSITLLSAIAGTWVYGKYAEKVTALEVLHKILFYKNWQSHRRFISF
jgi:uncharacterized membrane protein YedE/YeeE